MSRPKTPRPPKRSLMTFVFEQRLENNKAMVSRSNAPVGTYAYTARHTDTGKIRVVITYRNTSFVCATFYCDDVWDQLEDGLYVVFRDTDICVDPRVWTLPPSAPPIEASFIEPVPERPFREWYCWHTLVTRKRGHTEFTVSHVYGTVDDVVKKVLEFIDVPESTESDAVRLRVCAADVRADPYVRLWSTAWDMRQVRNSAWPICAVARTYLTEADALRQFNTLHATISLDLDAKKEKKE